MLVGRNPQEGRSFISFYEFLRELEMLSGDTRAGYPPPIQEIEQTALWVISEASVLSMNYMPIPEPTEDDLVE